MPRRSAAARVTPTRRQQQRLNDTKAYLLKAFASIVGLGSVREQVLYQIRRLNTPVINKIPANMHAVLMGNPGVGKTSVAKIWATTLFLMGQTAVRYNHEKHYVKAASLYGSVIGESGKAMRARIKGARGGVLVIDEAHELAKRDDGATYSFGDEVFQQIFMEMAGGDADRQPVADRVIFIFAGYKDPGPNGGPTMADLFRMNQGLERRIDVNMRLVLRDYDDKELVNIFIAKTQASGFHFEPTPRERAALGTRLAGQRISAYLSRTNGGFVDQWLAELERVVVDAYEGNDDITEVNYFGVGVRFVNDGVTITNADVVASLKALGERIRRLEKGAPKPCA